MIPWRLIGIGAAALVLAAVLWWVQARIRVSYQAEQERDTAIASLSAYQASVETAARVAAAQQLSDQKADAALVARLGSLESDNEALRRALARIPSTTEKPDANGVPRLAIAADWWLCRSSQLTHDPADVAACAARAGVAGVPNAVSR